MNAITRELHQFLREARQAQAEAMLQPHLDRATLDELLAELRNRAIA